MLLTFSPVTSSTDQQLMQEIKTQWGELLRATAATCSIPESFFAALVANESGGNKDAQRFESGVFAALSAVLEGTKTAYGSLRQSDLLLFAVPGEEYLPAALRTLATSYGLVQIMGYEAIAFHLDGVARLQDPQSELPICVKMYAQFAEHFELDLKKDFEQMFDLWNTGRPHAPTFDPKYIPNGLARKALYEGLP